MTKLLITIVILLAAIAGFMAGRYHEMAIASYISHASLESASFVIAGEPEGRARMAVINLALLERHDVASALKYNCRIAQAALRPMRNGVETTSKHDSESISRTINETEATLSRLNQSGMCISNASAPNNSFKPNPLRSFKTPSGFSGGSA
jgi:hypothetical protein